MDTEELSDKEISLDAGRDNCEDHSNIKSVYCTCEDNTAEEYSVRQEETSVKPNMETVAPVFSHNGIDRQLQNIVIEDEAPAFNDNQCSAPNTEIATESLNMDQAPFSQGLRTYFHGNEQALTTQPIMVAKTPNFCNIENGMSLQDASCPNSSTNTNRFDFLGKECPDDVHLPYRFPDGPVRRYVWEEEKREGGYNSDGDITRTKAKNKKLSLEGHLENSTKQSSSPFEKGHRRVRSGDSHLFNNPLINSAGSMKNDSHFNIVQKPEEVRNSSNLRQAPALNQSISVDCSNIRNTHPSQIYERLCLQSTSFVTLQEAIAEATKECELLEEEVEGKFRELEVGLNVPHCTQEDCIQAKKEIETLQKELLAMYNECDNSGVQIPGDPPDFDRKFSDAYPVSPTGGAAGGLAATTPIYPGSPQKSPVASGYTPSPVITHQPGKQGRRPRTSKDHPYENVPDYPSINKGDRGDSPPPLPPRQPMQMIDMKPANERWRCPKCTFDNLLVPCCEICQTPRPVLLRNSHH